MERLRRHQTPRQRPRQPLPRPRFLPSRRRRGKESDHRLHLHTHRSRHPARPAGHRLRHHDWLAACLGRGELARQFGDDDEDTVPEAEGGCRHCNCNCNFLSCLSREWKLSNIFHDDNNNNNNNNNNNLLIIVL